MEVFNFERDQKAIENLHEILFGNYNVVVITGAGISTLSGISDFRGINGLYARNPENIKKFYREYLENDPKGFYDFYTSQMMHEGIKPNIVHEVLAKLEERGLINLIITQNIDGLHEAAGSKKVINLHGDGTKFYCVNCRKDYTAEEYKKGYDVVDENREEKHIDGYICKDCGSIVRPAAALYDEPLFLPDALKAEQAMKDADKVVVLGSSLTVNTVEALLYTFINNKIGFLRKDIVIINNDSTRFDDYSYRSAEHLRRVFRRVNAQEIETSKKH